jgi:hypothetical protein
MPAADAEDHAAGDCAPEHEGRAHAEVGGTQALPGGAIYPRARQVKSPFRLPGFNAQTSQVTSENADPLKSQEQSGNSSSDKPADESWSEALSEPKKRGIWRGLDGIAVMAFGVTIPLLMMTLCWMSAPKRFTLVLLNHPIESMIEIILLVGIPMTILLIWKSLCKNDASFSIVRGLTLGGSIASAFLAALVCAGALFFSSTQLSSRIGTEFSSGFTFFTFMFLAAGTVAVYLANRIRLARDFQSSRLHVIKYTAFGAVLSLLAFIAAEARPWTIRLTELQAMSASLPDRKNGLEKLRLLAPERELRMECADSRAAGLSGLFIPLKTNSQHELYFKLTGKPYSFRDISNTDLSSMPDDYLSRNVVGERIKDLDMVRSCMTGSVHANTLTSTIDWIFVLKNSTTSPEEARAEIGMPPGAVLNGLTLWKNGEAETASVVPSGKAEAIATLQPMGHNAPAIVSDLGHGRMLLHCFPVPQETELKVGISMLVPLTPEEGRTASLVLPHLIATNFGIASESHLLRLKSTTSLVAKAAANKDLSCRKVAGGGLAIEGKLSEAQIKSAGSSILVAGPESFKSLAALDTTAIMISEEERRQREERNKRAESSERAGHEVIVMIDGSKGVEHQLENLGKALSSRQSSKSKLATQVTAVKPQFVLEEVAPIAAPAPQHLFVVVDASTVSNSDKDALCAALTKLPAGIPTKLIIASEEENPQSKAIPLEQGIAQLMAMQFVGGQNNLRAVIEAASLAGESAGGAVVWIHGAQPILNEEIYIMPTYAARPVFYELPLGCSQIDTYDFFKNHTEIGPFLQIPQNTSSLSEDLKAFCAKWTPSRHDSYAVTLHQTAATGSAEVIPSSCQEAKELLVLHAKQKLERLIADRHIRKAARIAIGYGIVSSCSCAIVLNQSQNVDSEETPNTADSGFQADDATQSDATIRLNAPFLKGATNGTIGPQGMDATYITGINTAGTVRVNNLANLEALLNIVSNLSEIGCALAGILLVIHGLAKKECQVSLVNGSTFEFTPFQRIGLGIALILLGLAVPGLVNWFVASARDANLFS